MSWPQMLWPLGLSLLALGVVATFTFEPGAFWTFARTVNPWLLGGACATTALRVFFGGWRFHFISGGRLGLAEGVRGQLAWDFLSNLTPTAIGGGPIAIVYLARDQDIPVGEASAFMLFSMVLDQLWFALSIPLLLAASSFFNVFPDVAYGFGHWTFFVVFTGMLLWAALFSYAILFRPRLLRRLAGRVFSLRLLRRFRHRVVREATRFSERAHRMREQSAAFYAKSFLLTIAMWMGRYLLAVLVVWSVYPALDVVLATLRSAALHMGGLLMPTPGGAGGVEGLYALFFGPLMPGSLMALTLLVWRFLGYYVFLALGVYLSFHQARQELQRSA
ncbi:MAG: hypothetical protein BRD46_05475 [Bacteroidetes bacterium QS_8_68_15]|nr:MAG: hypothetical protein BRD46_05475 [Bacteroidetes bacterium QS_8_68_15]